MCQLDGEIRKMLHRTETTATWECKFCHDISTEPLGGPR